MEGHTGGFGAVFAAAWFVFIFFTTPNISQSHFFGFTIFFIISFAALSWLSFWTGDHFAKKIRAVDELPSEDGTSALKDQLGEQVRRRITILSGLYVVVCCLLIWLTGGLLSPFIPFYIMIFTLTIEKCDVPDPGLYICFGFGILILATFGAFSYQTPPISTNEMVDILGSKVQKGMHVFFVIASLAVPTVSKYWQEEARREKLKDEAKKKEGSNRGTPS